MYNNYTPTKWENGKTYGADSFNNMESGICNLEKYALYKEKQIRNMASAIKKLRTGQQTSISMCGDSVWFGFNTLSSTGEDDPDNPTVLNTQKGDNEVTEMKYATGANVGWGNTTTTRRTKVQIPNVFIETMNDLYDGKITYIDKVYTGDCAKSGYYRWNASGADIWMCNYGINDAMAGHFASDYVGQTDEFINWYSALIERELNNGTACVIVTPVLQTQVVSYDTDSRVVVDVYEKILMELGDMYGIPVLNGNELNKNFSNRLTIDFTHFTCAGNESVGKKTAAPFVGGYLGDPLIVTDNAFIGVKPQQDNINVRGKAYIEYSDNSPTMPTLIDNNDLYDTGVNRIAKGLAVFMNYPDDGESAETNILWRQADLYARNAANKVNSDVESEEYKTAYQSNFQNRLTFLRGKHHGTGKVTWGFYCEEDGMVVIPSIYTDETDIDILVELDFGAIQGSPSNVCEWTGSDIIDYEYVEPSVAHIATKNLTSHRYNFNHITTSSPVIKITTKGWHSITLSSTENKKFEVYGLTFTSMHSYKKLVQ